MAFYWTRFLIPFIILLSGCWSTYSIYSTTINDNPPTIYGGIYDWYSCLTHYDTAGIWALYTILDVPFSFVLDTALLPITLFLNIIM